MKETQRHMQDHGITRRQFFKADKNWQNVTRNEYRSTIIAWSEPPHATSPADCTTEHH